jgi:hypothetical protein
MKEQKPLQIGIIVNKADTNRLRGDSAVAYCPDSLVYKSNFDDRIEFFSSRKLERLQPRLDEISFHLFSSKLKY